MSQAIAALKAEKAQLEAQLLKVCKALVVLGAGDDKPVAAVNKFTPKKVGHPMSKAARAKISASLKARYAAQKAAA